jgi:hypothetical protein
MRKRAASLHGACDWFRAWKLSAASVALLYTTYPKDRNDREQLIARVKNFTLPLRGPRPMAEAISSAGGVRWSELDADLMLRKLPGVFVAGEMIDWEAPTGGYLLQGCFSTGTRAGRSGGTPISQNTDEKLVETNSFRRLTPSYEDHLLVRHFSLKPAAKPCSRSIHHTQPLAKKIDAMKIPRRLHSRPTRSR